MYQEKAQTQRRRTNGSGARRTETNARKNTNCQYGPTNSTAFQCYHRYCTTRDSGWPWWQETTSRWVAQNEAPVLNPVSFDKVTKNDEIAADVPLPEEPVVMSGDRPRSWITEGAFLSLAWRTTSTATQGDKNEPVDTCGKTRVPEEHGYWVADTAREPSRQSVVSGRKRLELESVGQIVRCMLVGLVSGSQTTACHEWRGAKARLIMKGFTDPDLLDIESHSPTLTRESFRTVLQSVCSHGHKSFNTVNPIKREQPLLSECRPMTFQVNLVMFGCSCSRQLTDWPKVRENGGTVFLPPPEDWVLRRRFWKRVFWCWEVHNRDTIVSLEWSSKTLLVEERKSGNKLSRSFKKTFHLRTLGSGKKKTLQSRGHASNSWIHARRAAKSLDFVPLGRLRKEHSGDATEIEKNAMRSMLGVLGCSARECRPDLSGPVWILQSRFNRAHVSDIPETNRLVRLANAHRDLALPVLQNSFKSNLFCVLRRCQGCEHASWASSSWVRGHDSRPGFVGGRNDSSRDSGILEISSCQTCCSQRFIKMTVVFGLSLRAQENVPPHIGHGFQK